jgi:hypothetical protein
MSMYIHTYRMLHTNTHMNAYKQVIFLERLRAETEQAIAARAVRMHTMVLNAITEAEAKLYSKSLYVCM